MQRLIYWRPVIDRLEWSFAGPVRSITKDAINKMFPKEIASDWLAGNYQKAWPCSMADCIPVAGQSRRCLRLFPGNFCFCSLVLPVPPRAEFFGTAGQTGNHPGYWSASPAISPGSVWNRLRGLYRGAKRKSVPVTTGAAERINSHVAEIAKRIAAAGSTGLLPEVSKRYELSTNS